jgi:4-hydroxybenzoate polyprenyltransferase/glycosyltransferase involved in cell wall biosynthesis
MTQRHRKTPPPNQPLPNRRAGVNVVARIGQVLAASRPVSWINTAFPFAVAYLLSGGQLDGLFWAAVVYFLLPYNLLVYGVNDIYDYASDLKNPRKGSLEGSIVAPDSRRYLWGAIIFTNAISLAWLASLVDQSGWLVLAITVFCAISYSVKGLRFKEIPLLDSFNSACHFVLPAIFGFVVSPSGQIVWLPIIAFTLWGIASHALGAIQDIVPDRAGKFRSIATQWGVRPTTRLAFFCYLASAGLTAFVAWPNSVYAALLVGVYAFNAAMFLKYSSDAQSKHFRRAWTNFMWLNGVIGFWLTQLIIFVADPFGLGPTRLDYILTFCTLFSIAQIMLIAHIFRRPKTQRLDEWPRLTIMIHAYNQAENISSTLLAALGQNYPDFEVLFTDLGSEDNTLKIAQNFTDKRLRILSIDPIEKGWGVNAWAADQLLGYATGEYAVLISADTVLLPNTLAQIASLLEQEKLDVLSLLSADQNKSLAQKMILSHNQYLMLAAYPSGYLQENAPDRSTAHGSIIAFDTAKTRDLGGFEDVKASPLEDQELFHRARKKGLQAKLFRASDLATSQNHLGLRAIIDDNIQRYYPALRFHFPLVIFLTLGGTFVFSAPLIILVYSILTNTQIDLLSFGIALGANILTRIIVAVEAKQDIPAQLLAPLTNLIIMPLLLVSCVEYELRKPRWKNRTGIA